MGQSPFPKFPNVLEFMNYITKSPVLTLPAGFSPGFSDFISNCLITSPAKRPGATQMLVSTWIDRGIAASVRAPVCGGLQQIPERMAELDIIINIYTYLSHITFTRYQLPLFFTFIIITSASM